MSTTLGDELPKEMARVRDELLPLYLEIGAAGAPAVMFMRRSLDKATQALAEGDLQDMILAYQELKGYRA